MDYVSAPPFAKPRMPRRRHALGIMTAALETAVPRCSLLFPAVTAAVISLFSRCYRRCFLAVKMSYLRQKGSPIQGLKGISELAA